MIVVSDTNLIIFETAVQTRDELQADDLLIDERSKNLEALNQNLHDPSS